MTHPCPACGGYGFCLRSPSIFSSLEIMTRCYECDGSGVCGQDTTMKNTYDAGHEGTCIADDADADDQDDGGDDGN